MTGTGTSTVVEQTSRDEEFAAYMHARQPSLLRTAYLLTGDRHSAEDLTQTALAKLYLSWDKVQRRELVDGYVRRILVNEHNSLWRRAWKRREVTTDALPDVFAPLDRPDTGEAGAPVGLRAVAAAQATGGRGAALLRGPQRGRDRRRPRHLRRHRQESGQPCDRVDAVPGPRPTPAEPGGGAMSHSTTPTRTGSTRGLHDQADRVHGAPLALDDGPGPGARHPAAPPRGGGPCRVRGGRGRRTRRARAGRRHPHRPAGRPGDDLALPPRADRPAQPVPRPHSRVDPDGPVPLVVQDAPTGEPPRSASSEVRRTQRRRRPRPSSTGST